MQTTPLIAWPKARVVAAAIVASLVTTALLVALLSSRALDHEPYEYDIAAWEIRHIPNKWLYELGSLFREEPRGAEADALVARFLELNREIEDLENTAPEGGGAAPSSELVDRRRERDQIENDVEAIIEERLTTLLEDAGLDSDLLLLHA